MNEKTSGMFTARVNRVMWMIRKMRSGKGGCGQMWEKPDVVQPGPKTRPIGSCFLPEVAA